MRGGKREGAGRKPSVYKRTPKEIAEHALSKGASPLEVCMDAMRHFLGKAANSKDNQRDEHLLRAATIAKDLMPFCHPRIQAVMFAEAKPGDGAEDATPKYTNKELARRLLFMALSPDEPKPEDA